MFQKLNRCMPAMLLLAFAFTLLCSAAMAQTDITAVVSSISDYWDAAKAIAIAILLFVIGRRVVQKI